MMNEQTLKDLGIELNKLKIKENDILIMRYDRNKIKVDEMYSIAMRLKESLKNEIVIFPIEINLYNFNKSELKEFQKRFNKVINEIMEDIKE